MNDRQRTNSIMLTAVFIAIVIWAALIAIGVFHRSGGNWAKTSIIIGVVAVFLGGWLVILKRRS